MAAAADSDSHLIRTRKPDCLDDIVFVGDLHDVSRAPIGRELIPDHGAPEALVTAVGGTGDRSSDAELQFLWIHRIPPWLRTGCFGFPLSPRFKL
jgi:hypothetical protein